MPIAAPLAASAHAAALPLPAGIGMRAPHHGALLEQQPPVGWLEIHAESYMGGGASLHYLDQARQHWPIAVHGTGLGLGGAEPPNAAHLERLAALVARIEPFLVSEHLAWTGIDGRYYNDQLPLPYTDETLEHTSRNIAAAMHRLRRPILIENPATYLRYSESHMSEVDFLTRLVENTGCGLLCDISNIYVSSFNHIGAGAAYAVAEAYLEALPRQAVQQLHLAGYSESDADGDAILIDDHGTMIAEPVWRLYRHAVQLFPEAQTLIEWDSNIPPLSALVAEAALADQHRADSLGSVEEPADEQAA
ncbi:DUF692 domain-containing protein [Ferrovibrio sp.]|uniref:MNIO family bufferin maturase n=1 Tax=Ferrovibrio sp. TaxID=1917215 RepID=UPI003D11EFFB